MTEKRDLEGISALVTRGHLGHRQKQRPKSWPARRRSRRARTRRRPRRGGWSTTITAEGGKARFVAADLGDPAQLDHLVDQVGAVVTLLVNNAASPDFYDNVRKHHEKHYFFVLMASARMECAPICGRLARRQSVLRVSKRRRESEIVLIIPAQYRFATRNRPLSREVIIRSVSALSWRSRK